MKTFEEFESKNIDPYDEEDWTDYNEEIILIIKEVMNKTLNAGHGNYVTNDSKTKAAEIIYKKLKEKGYLND